MNEQEEYGKKVIHLQNGKAQEIRQIYDQAIINLTSLAATLPYKQTIFNLSLYPLLQKRVEYILRDMAGKLEIAIVNGIDQAWSLSDEKNRVFLDRRLKKYNLSIKARKRYYDPNEQAKTAFKKREVKGLNLSKRIWKTLDPFKNQIVLNLGEGIAEGQSAAAMARQMKRDLVEPDRLYRRVRGKAEDPNSRLRLSKAAMNYSPGQGVYRSSIKNALRLTRTETNISYRSADYDRWMTQPFVVGIEVRLSDAHPREDICDPLAGKYPKDFKWTGWHPQCICFQIPIMITAEEMDKYQDEIFGLGKWDGKSVNRVEDAPSAFYEYLEVNAEGILNRASLPYWVQDNMKYTSKMLAG